MGRDSPFLRSPSPAAAPGSPAPGTEFEILLPTEPSGPATIAEHHDLTAENLTAAR
ncbi:MAG: hypothetical protein AAF892_07630 [Cyanobacteria bacterium P01_D01_bin.71]